MRNYNSILLFLFFVFSSFLSIGQSLHLRPQQNSFFSEANTLQEAHLTVFNSTAHDLTVMVKRVSNVLDSAHVSYFCWGPYCYSPFTNVSNIADTIFANDSNTTFKGYLEPNGAEGESKVGYCFYDENHINDSICMNFIYHFGALGLIERNQSLRVSEAYPNPTKNFTSISYSLPANNTVYVFKLFDMQGKLISQQKITDRNSMLLLPLEGLASGIYQASFFENGKCFVTKKIVLLP